MPRPTILEKLYSHLENKDTPHVEMGWVNTSDEEELGDALPVDANTLEGHPASFFASKTDVNNAIANYVATVLGKSY